MFFNPDAYNILPFYNNYTEDKSWVKTAYFIPANIAFYREGYVDKRGVCNIKKATEYYMNERAKLESSPKALIDYKAEYCLFPSEAFAIEGQNDFNKVKLVEQITAIKFKKRNVPEIQRGYFKFIYNNPDRKRDSFTGVQFIPKKDGPVYILQHPLWEIKMGEDREPDESDDEYKNRKEIEGEVTFSKMSNLYVAGIDGIDLGQQDTSEQTKNPSKFCTTIKRRIHGMKAPTYVAYYLDRPQRIEEAYEQTIALLFYYNAMANLEASKVGILGWAKREKWMKYFMRRPRICSGDPNKKRSGTSPYGTTTSVAMIQHGLSLVADYIENYWEEVWFLDMLDQLLKYSFENKGKFDIVASMQMCEIADEELSEVVPVAQKPVSEDFQDIGFYIDENGRRQYGIIPKNNWNTPVRASLNGQDYVNINITSNPRYR